MFDKPFDKIGRVLELPWLAGEMQNNWGSEHADSRALIRSHLVQYWQSPLGHRITDFQNFSNNPGSSSVIEELDEMRSNKIPNLPWASQTISHCKTAGGWMATSPRFGIGMDLEEHDRLNMKLISRIASEDESSQAPNPLYLWAAKEAAFKSQSRRNQPQIFSQIKIESWNKLDSYLFKFEFKRESEEASASGRGLIWDSDRLIMGISVQPL